jgi:hypothetical protein
MKWRLSSAAVVTHLGLSPLPRWRRKRDRETLRPIKRTFSGMDFALVKLRPAWRLKLYRRSRRNLQLRIPQRSVSSDEQEAALLSLVRKHNMVPQQTYPQSTHRLERANHRRSV